MKGHLVVPVAELLLDVRDLVKAELVKEVKLLQDFELNFNSRIGEAALVREPAIKVLRVHKLVVDLDGAARGLHSDHSQEVSLFANGLRSGTNVHILPLIVALHVRVRSG